MMVKKMKKMRESEVIDNLSWVDCFVTFVTHNNVRGLGLVVLLHFPFQFILYHNVIPMSSGLVRGETKESG